MGPDRNLLALALAFRAGLLDPERVAQACALWSDDRDRSVLEVLAERGWIDARQRADVEAQVVSASRVDDTMARAAVGQAVAEGPSNPGTIGAPMLKDLGTALGPALPATEFDGSGPPPPIADDTIDHRTEPATNGREHASTDGATIELPPHAGHVLLSTMASTPGARTHYSRDKLHAKGGMGQVWLARDHDLGRDVALKELRPEQAGNRRTRERFLTEARITGQLEHPSIVPVYELVTDGDGCAPFYTMRMVRGRTLSQAVEMYHQKRLAGTADALELARLLNAFVAVCHAIAFAHSKRFIHRDLKGQNIVLGDFGEVMVLDWGLAKAIDGPETVVEASPSEAAHDGPLGRTVNGQVMGTPAFMSPEQAAGDLDRVGPLSDVYGLGAVLAEVLTGRPPFSGQTTKDLLRKVREEAPVPPRQVNPQAPAALEAICLKAMAKDPADRYASATELAREVERLLADEPVAAYPEPALARLGRWARRHRSAVASLTGLAAVVMIALGVGFVLVRAERDEAQRQRTEAQRQRAFARQAAEDMYSEFGQYWLEDFLDPVQRVTLEKARDAFARFDEEQASEPDAARQRGRANARLATIAQKLGDLEGAERAFGAAEAFLAKQVDSPGAKPEDLLELADAQVQHARLKARTGKLDEARSSLESIIARLETAQKTGSDAAPLLGRAAMALADVHRVAGRPNEAESAFQQAIDHLRGPASRANAPFAVRRDLAAALEGQGLSRHDREWTAEAETSLREAQAVGETLLAQFPTVAIVRDGLARTQITLGRVHEAKKETDKARAAFLASVGHYQRLADDFPSRPEYRRGLARAHLNLGNLVFRGDGQDVEAERSYRQGIAIHEALDQPLDDFKYQRDLARAHTNLGTLATAQGRYDEAAAAFAKSAELLGPLVARFPEVPELAASQAVLAVNQGDLDSARQDYPAAIAHYERAVAGYGKLIEAHPDVARYRREQAQTFNGLAIAQKSVGAIAQAETSLRASLAIYDEQYRRTKQAGYLPLMASSHTNLGELRLPGAEDEYRRSLAIFREVVQANPRTTRYQENLATALINLGSYLDETQADGADALFDEAVGRLEGLVTAQPESHRARYLLANVLGRQAKRLLADDPLRAGALLQTAVYHEQRALDAAPGLMTYRDELLALLESLATARLRVKDDQAAEAIAAMMVQVAPRESQVQTRAARVLAKAAQASVDERAKALADQALALLGKAADAKVDLVPLATDDDFQALRDRDDFRALVAPPK